MAVAEAVKVGKVVQIIGPVVDIEFAGGYLPAIYNALRITGKAGDVEVDVIVEVEQLIEEEETEDGDHEQDRLEGEAHRRHPVLPRAAPAARP